MGAERYIAKQAGKAIKGADAAVPPKVETHIPNGITESIGWGRMSETTQQQYLKLTTPNAQNTQPYLGTTLDLGSLPVVSGYKAPQYAVDLAKKDITNGKLEGVVKLRATNVDGRFNFEDLNEQQAVIAQAYAELGIRDVPVAIRYGDEILQPDTAVPHTTRINDRDVPLEYNSKHQSVDVAPTVWKKKDYKEKPSRVFRYEGDDPSVVIASLFDPSMNTANTVSAKPIREFLDGASENDWYDISRLQDDAMDADNIPQPLLDQAEKYSSASLDRWLEESDVALEYMGVLPKEVNRYKSPYKRSLIKGGGKGNIVWHHIGMDKMKGTDPYSLEEGVEIGMNLGSIEQTNNFRSHLKMGGETVPYARDNFTHLWKELDNQLMDEDLSEELWGGLQEIYLKNLKFEGGAMKKITLNEDAFLKEAAEHLRKSELDPDFTKEAQKDLYEMNQDALDLHAQLNLTNDEVNAQKYAKDGDTFDELAYTIMQLGVRSQAQVESAYVVVAKRPLVLRNIVDFHPGHVAEQLMEHPQFQTKYADELEWIWNNGKKNQAEGGVNFVEAKKRIIKVMESEGYDHILYTNNYDTGGGAIPSIIVWKKDGLREVGHLKEGNSLASYGKAFSGFVGVGGAASTVAPTNKAEAKEVPTKEKETKMKPTSFNQTKYDFDHLAEREVGIGADGKLKEANLQASYIKRSDGTVEDKLTIGIGHHVKDGEINKETGRPFVEGETISKEYVRELFEQDTQEAVEAAEKQAVALKIDDKDFIEALISVNFQNGKNWYLKHKETWRLLKEGEYEDAIPEAQRSKWYRQTPVRVRDFQKAIKNLIRRSNT